MRVQARNVNGRADDTSKRTAAVRRRAVTGNATVPISTTAGAPASTGATSTGTTGSSAGTASDATPTPFGTIASGGPSGSCSGSQMCLTASGSGATPFDVTFGTQDTYSFLSWLNPSPAPVETIFQRMSDADFGMFRQLGADSYGNFVSTQVDPVQHNTDGDGLTDGWNFIALDEALSDVPTNVPREVQQNIPPTMLYCSSGSWTVSPYVCSTSGKPSGFIDQTFADEADFYSDIVKYFTTPMTTSDSGGTVSYGANTLTDTGQNFAGDAGDCVTATITDSMGFQNWVQGTIAAIGGAGNHQLTLTATWSAKNSWDETGNTTNTKRLSGTTPQAGNAYNVASCTPPGDLSGPQAANPWPRPPSVGNVQYYELGNEPDLSYNNLYASVVSSVPPPLPTLSGASTSGGKLSPGSQYCYEVAAANSAGDDSLPSAQQCLTLPAGDNAVQVSWSATSHDGAVPIGYVIYGRTSGSQRAVAGVGEWAAGGLTWTDDGAVTPVGSPNTTDQSAGGNFFTPPIYARYWNVVTAAMKAADPSVKVTGPTASNSIGIAGRPWLDPYCVTTSGLGSACANGDSGWMNNQDYLPYLEQHATTALDMVTFHAYGGTSIDNEASNWSGLASEISNYRADDQSYVDAAEQPVSVDEVNLNASGVGSQSNATQFQAMTQFGSAFMADNVVQWAKTDPLVESLVQHMDYSTDASFTLFGDTNTEGDESCVPQPSCQNDRPGEPDLPYWSEYWIDHWMTHGTLINLTNVPSDFDAVADQTGPKTIVVLLVNKQPSPGSTNGTGVGAAGDFDLQIQGAAITDSQEVSINGSTTWATGPAVQDLGAESNDQVDASGYEVDLIKYSLS